MTNTEQLEREAQQTRAQVLDTLQELRTRITPGQVVDQLVDYTRDGGGGAFFRNLGRQVVNNPLPLTLMGASLAWLMLSGGRPGDAIAEGMTGAGGAAADRPATGARRIAEKARSGGEELSGRVGSATSAIGDAASRAASGVSDAASRMSEAAADATSSIGERAAAAYGNASQTVTRAAAAVGDSASTIGKQVSARSNDLIELWKERPLVLAGIGVAVGAAIGSMLPTTEAENRLLGETSEEIKERTRDIASEQYEKAKNVAAAAFGEARKAAETEAEKQGLLDSSDTGSKDTLAENGPKGDVAAKTSASSANQGSDGQAADRSARPGGSV
jgi:hypothetical protein